MTSAAAERTLRALMFPGVRPVVGGGWVVVLHDGHDLRVHLQMYEPLGDGFLHDAGISGQHIPEDALQGSGHIGALHVACDSPESALRCKSGHSPRHVHPGRRV